jgi:hypothetical protein
MLFSVLLHLGLTNNAFALAHSFPVSPSHTVAVIQTLRLSIESSLVLQMMSPSAAIFFK